MTLSVRIRKAAPLLPVVDELLAFARSRLVKASTPAALKARDKLFAKAQPAMAAALVEFFDGLLSRAGVAKDAAFPFDPETDIDWPAERKRLRQVLEAWYGQMGDAAFATLSDQLGLELSFDLEAASSKPIRALIGANVASITDTLRETLRNRVSAAIDAGLSVDELVRGTDTLPGLQDLFDSRAQTIALTETATAYNATSLAGYEDSGLVEMVEVFDGPECGWTEHDDPDLADGSTRTLEEANAYPISHPNCQRAFGPVVAR